MQGFSEVDLRCTVVTVHSSSSTLERNTPSGHSLSDNMPFATKIQNSVLDLIYVTDIDAEVDGCLAVIKLWGGIQVCLVLDL